MSKTDMIVRVSGTQSFQLMAARSTEKMVFGVIQPTRPRPKDFQRRRSHAQHEFFLRG